MKLNKPIIIDDKEYGNYTVNIAMSTSDKGIQFANIRLNLSSDDGEKCLESIAILINGETDDNQEKTCLNEIQGSIQKLVRLKKL